jgi:hypothetical protein
MAMLLPKDLTSSLRWILSAGVVVVIINIIIIIILLTLWSEKHILGLLLQLLTISLLVHLLHKAWHSNLLHLQHTRTVLSAAAAIPGSHGLTQMSTTHFNVLQVVWIY